MSADRPEDIGRRLQSLRMSRGQTQQVVADKLHVAVSTVNKWESGELYPSFLQLVNMAKTLHLDICWLIGFIPTGEGDRAR